MKKYVFISVLSLSVIYVAYLLFQNNTLTPQETHYQFLKNHPFQKTLTLSKQERLTKGIPPNKYFEEKYLLEINPFSGRTHPENIYTIQQELHKKRNLQARAPGDAIDNTWEERGPNNVGGRTRAVLFDPNDATHKRVFAGGVSGGLWVNDDITDANSSWERVGIDENLSITCMAVDPNNSQIMYLGTGELYVAQQALGNGIWKSTDGGATWENIYKVRGTTSSGSVPGTYYITDIVVRDKDGDAATTNDSEVFASIGASFYSSNPTNTFVGVNDYGIYKSTDEGNSWNQVTLDVNGNSIAPNDFEIGIDNTLWLATTRNVYGDGGGRIYSSSDGTNFTLKHTIANGRRTEISVSKQNANTVYVLGRLYNVDASNQFIAPFVSILKTTDAFATTPTSLALPNDADTGIPANDFTRGQAFYNLMIEPHPTDDTTVYVGGIDLFKTTDSGSSWTQISKWSNNNNLAALDVSLVHADQHTMVFHPTNANVAIFGNDGGVYYSSNLSDTATNIAINSRNKDYNTSQFYHADIGQVQNSDYLIGGTQDNGTQFINNATKGVNSATKVFGGDGTMTFIDATSNYMIVTYLYNRILKFDFPYTGNYTVISTDRNTGSFVNSMDLDKNLDILYSNGTNHLARFTNITTNSPTRTNITDALLNDITAIKVSPFTTTSSKVFAGTRTGKLVKIENAETETQTITDISSSSFLGSISNIEFGQNEDEIMVTFYNFGVESIWFTEDGGTNWNNKEGDFPDINVRCILMNPLHTNEVIIGSELGVWYSTNFRDASPSWHHSYNGMSNVAVTSLSLRTSDNTVLASSFGRGLYTGQFKSNSLTVWKGTTDTNWTTASNWTNGIPTSTMDVSIPETTNQPIINSSVTIKNLAIQANTSVSISETGKLTIEENVTNNDTISISSTETNSGSLIVKGSSTGHVAYLRSTSTNWHLMSSPVNDEVYDDDWVLTNKIKSSTNNPNLRAIGTYSSNTNSWTYMLKETSATFLQGIGYGILKSEVGNTTFIGTMPTDEVSLNIQEGTATPFTLVGNPYPSYVPLNDDANASINFLSENASSLGEQTVWFWDGSSYIPKNLITGSEFIAPSQGFFVKAKSTATTLVFSEDLQEHQSTNFFKSKINTNPKISVFLSEGKIKKQTDIYYVNNTTTGFDNGYDSSLYANSDVEVYTLLVDETATKKLSIQALPVDYNVQIPLGFTATKNTDVKITIASDNLPEDLKIYIEDKVTGNFFLVNNKTAFVFNTNNEIRFERRFYIHTSREILTTTLEEYFTADIMVKEHKIEFKNLPFGDKKLNLYTVLGKSIKEMATTKINDVIQTNTIAKGIYLVAVEYKNQVKVKKILIQ